MRGVERAPWITSILERWLGPITFLGLTLLPVLFLAVRIPSHTSVEALGLTRRTLRLLTNTSGLAVAVAVATAILGTGLALWLAGGDGPVRRFVGHVFFIPLLAPAYVFALTWASLLARRSTLNDVTDGVFGFRLSSFGFMPAALTLSLVFFPIVTMVVRAALSSMDSHLIDAGRIVATDKRVWWRIVIPALTMPIAIGSLVVFALTLVEYGVPALFQYNVYSMEVFADYGRHADAVAALVSTLPLIALAAIVFAGAATLFRRSPLRPRPGPTIDALEPPRTIRWWRGLGITALILSSAVPVLVMAGDFGTLAELADATSSAREDIITSLVVGVAAAVIASAVAIPSARWLDRRDLGPATFLYILPLAVPAPLFAMGLIEMWSNLPSDAILGRMPMLVLAHVGRLLPLAVLVQVIQLRRIDRSLFESALLYDVGSVRRLRRIALPLMKPALIASSGVVFLLSLGELGASLLTVPPGRSTLPLRMFNLLHYGAGDEVAAVSLATIAIVLIVVALSSRAVRR